MTELQRLENYTHLLNRKQFSLVFPKEIEKAYQANFRYQFLTSNKKLVTFGLFFYMSFVIADYVFFHEQFVNLTIFRFSVVAICLSLLYTIYIKENYRHVIRATLLSNIVMGSQMFISGILFFKQPLDILYATGVFPIMIYGIILFQTCYKKHWWWSLAYLSGYC